MAKFLIGTTPMVGPVAPAGKIAKALADRGHEVRWYTGSRFRKRVEISGAVFEPMVTARDYSEMAVPEAFPRVMGKTGLKALKTIFEDAFVDTAKAQLKDVQAILSRFPADVVLSDSVFLGGALAHALGGPPFAKFGDTVLGHRSRDTAPHGSALPPSSSPLGRLRNRALQWVHGRLVMRDLRSKLDGVRKQLGLPRGPRYFFDAFDSPFLWLQCSVPSFEYPRSDLPPMIHFIGPVLPDPMPDFTPPTWWPEMQERRRPVVHVTQGTWATEADALLFPTIEALADQPVQVVATTGGGAVDQVLGGRKLPANTKLETFLPHTALLPHVDIMVTNGGANGVQAALAHAVPMVVAGNTEEKPEVAMRVAWSGVGIDLRTGKPTQKQIRDAVRRILALPSFKAAAKRIAGDIAKHDAPREAAELLERLASTKQMIARPS